METIPGDASVAKIGSEGNDVLRVTVRAPVPLPLSKAVAVGKERGLWPWTKVTSWWARGIVMRSTWV